MSFTKSFTVLIASSLFSVAAGAWPWFHSCGDYQTQVWRTESRTITKILGSCQPVKLRIGTVDGGAGWHGGYDRLADVENVIVIEHYDRCSGESLGTTTTTDHRREMIPIHVRNVNLEDASGPSYIHQDAPLTDAEAKAALPDALRRCQALKPGPL